MSARTLATLLVAALAACSHEPGKDGVAPPTDEGGDTGIVDTDTVAPVETDAEDTDTNADTDAVDTETDLADTDTDLLGDTGDTGPVIPIDSAAPDLEIFEPAHGTWLPEGPVDLYGSVTDASPFTLTVDGQPLAPGVDGTFATGLEAGVGVRIVETRAVDDAGNVATDARAVMIGDELPSGTVLDDAILVRLDEGTGGLDTLEQLAEQLITPEAIAGLIPSPVISQSSQNCISIPFVGTQCVTWYALDLFVDDVTFAGFTVDLDPKAGGHLLATVTVSGLDVAWHADGKVVGIGQSFSGHMTADAIVVSLDVTPTVDAGGDLAVTVNGTSVSLVDFQAGLPGWITDVAGFFGIDVDQIVTDQLKAQLDAVVRDQLPSILSDALGSLAAPIALDVAGVTLELSVAPSSVTVDETGMTIGLGLGVSALPDSRPGVGSLYVGWHAPAFPGTVGARVAVSMDAVNQLLRGAWAAGLAQVADLIGGGGTIDVSLLIPGATEASVDVDGALPPVMVPFDAASAELQVGDLELRLVDPQQAPLLSAWTSLRAQVSASIAGSDLSFAATPLQVALDVEGALPRHQDALESTFEALAIEILPALSQTIGAIPIPTIAGFGLTQTSITFDGPEHGYVLVSGQLTETP